MANLRCSDCHAVFAKVPGDERCPHCGNVGAKPTKDAVAPPLNVPITSRLPAVPTTPRASSMPMGSLLAVVLAVMLVLAGATYALFFAPFAPFRRTTTPLAPSDVQVALDELQALTSKTNHERPWGVTGTFTPPPQKGQATDVFQVTILWEPGHGAYEIHAVSGPAVGFDYDKRQQGAVINYLRGGETFLGRDEKPTTVAAVGDDGSTASPRRGIQAGDFGPASGRDEDLGGRDVTHFSTTNGTHHTELWIEKSSKRIVKLSGTDPKDGSYELRVLRGDEVHVDVDPSATRRASFKLVQRASAEHTTEAYVQSGIVDANHTEEVKLDEVEIRVLEGGAADAPEIARMRLDVKHSVVNGFDLTYDDKDNDGLVSAGDRYVVKGPPDKTTARVRFYDLWADAYEGGPLPGFQLALLAVALTLVGSILRRRH